MVDFQWVDGLSQFPKNCVRRAARRKRGLVSEIRNHRIPGSRECIGVGHGVGGGKSAFCKDSIRASSVLSKNCTAERNRMAIKARVRCSGLNVVDEGHGPRACFAEHSTALDQPIQDRTVPFTLMGSKRFKHIAHLAEVSLRTMWTASSATMARFWG